MVLHYRWKHQSSNNWECNTGPHRWYHIAFVRNGTTGTFYINGIADTTTVSFGSNSIRDTGNAFRIGANLESGSIDQEFKGFISNLRVVKGTAVYTSNFTAPTEPLTNVTNTKLLCCNSSTSATASTVTPGSITANGDAFATRNELSGSTVLAIPGIAGGQGSGYITNGNFDIKGSGTNKTIIPGKCFNWNYWELLWICTNRVFNRSCNIYSITRNKIWI